ncbi:transporter [Escherichia coli]|nr:transporter [Escherichia coli]
MAKPIITLNGLKIVIMLGMLVIILCGIRFAAEIIVPLFSHYLLLLFLTRWCNTWSAGECRVYWRCRF